MDTVDATPPPIYIYPPYPSPSSKIPPSELEAFERTKRWVVQRKFNGSRTGVRVYREDVSVYDRHGGNLISIPLTDSMKECVLSLNLKPDVGYWLDGEFLHKKAKVASTDQQAAKDTLVLFDVLYLGRYLNREDQLTRLDLLADICHHPTEHESKERALQVVSKGSSHIWMAETFNNDFEYLFYQFYDYDERGNDLHPEIEGVVLRNKQFVLKNLGAKKYSLNGEVVRCRKRGKVRNF